MTSELRACDRQEVGKKQEGAKGASTGWPVRMGDVCADRRGGVCAEAKVQETPGRRGAVHARPEPVSHGIRKRLSQLENLKASSGVFVKRKTPASEHSGQSQFR